MTLQKLTYREKISILIVVIGFFFSIEKSCAVHYEYDIHGNVKSLLHDNPVLAAQSSSLANQRYKRLDYTYDLISGNVLQVSYQNAQPDAWHHRYEYDADNRITHTLTSSVPSPLENDWELDAHYIYYHHGPLARVELGEHTVQGIDMSYTLQGWLKGVNSESLLAERDMGKDGHNALGNINKYFAKDAFGFSLGYFENDYQAISQPTALNNFLADKTGSNLLASTSNLYNGNISNMVTTIVPPTLSVGTVTYAPAPQGTAYKYDRLNRLKQSNAWQDINVVDNTWATGNGSTYAGMYENTFSYNANGGMLTALAKNAMGETIDNQTYHRATTTNGRYINNRTYAITDVATQTSGEDLLDQQTFDNTVLSNNNYDFTEIGERNKNLSEDIESITWTVYGKKAGVKRTATSGKNNVIFNYDPQNNRIAKHVYTSDDIWINSEYYVHDAQGNLMATYRLEASSGSGLSYKLTERHIYGSNNLGIVTTPVEMIGANTPTDTYPHIIGDKRFNGSNHLNNVLSVFTDKKLPLDVDNNGIIDGYLPQVISANDYAPFGSRLAERTFNKELYPNSFNGKRESAELDGEQDYGERDYNPKEREFDKDDKLITQKQQYPWYSPYQFAGNNPIKYIDLDGLEEAESPMTDGGQFGYDNTLIVTRGENFSKMINETFNSIMKGLALPFEALQNFHFATNQRAQNNPEFAKKHARQFNYDIVSLSIDYILGAGFVKVTKALIPISRKLIPNTSFKEGATHITTTDFLEKFKDSPTHGGDALFVAPSREIDELINSGATRLEIEKALGLEPGRLDGGDLVRIDIAPDAIKNLRLPKGNEAAANNNFVSGGKTSGGISEGVIDPIKKGSSGVSVKKIKEKPAKSKKASF